jgi:hypothetical protein
VAFFPDSLLLILLIAERDLNEQKSAGKLKKQQPTTVLALFSLMLATNAATQTATHNPCKARPKD